MTRVGKRRLIILLGIFLLAIGALIGANVVREMRKEKFARESHAAGMAAFERGDYASALRDLPYAVNRGYDDGETLLALAESRLRVTEENNAHVANAAERFNRAAQAMPDDPRPLRRLLHLYLQIGFLNERVGAAQRLLAIDPTDREALEALVETYYYLGQRREADEAAVQFTAAYPTSPTAHRWRLATLQANGAGAEELAEYVDNLVAANPESPAFAIVQAEVYGTLGRNAEAREIAQRVAQQPPTDGETLESLVRLLDRLMLSEEADRLLVSADDAATEDATFDLLRVQRAYRRGNRDLAESIVKAADPTSDDDDLVGWTAFLLPEEEAGRTARATLTGRGSPEARFWMHMLTGIDGINSDRPQVAREAFEQARMERPTEPLPTLFLGSLDMEFGELDRAVALLESAVEGHGTWIEARNLLTEAYLRTGRIDDALRTVQGTAGLAPESGTALLLMRVYVQALRAEPSDAALMGDTLGLADLLLRSTNRNGDVHGLAATAYLLAGRQGRAIELMDTMLAERIVPRPFVLIDLATTAQAALPTDSTYPTRLLELAMAEGRADARIVGRLAELRARAGRAGEGRQIIESAIAEASSPAAKIEMQIALALYLDRRGDTGALSMLADLAQANPTNQEVQLAVLQSESAWADSALVESTINRLRDIMGAGTTTWRIYEAQRLLSTAKTEADALAVVRLLSPVVQRLPNNARVQQLTGDAYLVADDSEAAIRNYGFAVDSGGAAPSTWIRLISLLQREGRSAEAGRRLNEFMQISVPVEQTQLRRERARLLAAQGLLDQSLLEYERIAEYSGAIGDRLMVARLHARVGNDANARLAYEALVTSDDLDETTLLAAADFFATENEFDRGLALIQDASEDVLAEADKPLQLAGYFERHGRYDRAQEALEGWARDTGSAGAWEAIAQFHIRRGSLEAAEAAARSAVAADPDSASAAGVLALLEVMRTGDLRAEATDPLAALVQPEQQEVFRALLRVEQWRQANPTDTQGLIDRLRQLTVDYPTEFRVWARLIEAASAAGRTNEAVAFADAAVEALPTSIAAARLETNMLIFAERWNDAQLAGERWRQLTRFDTYDADLTLAFIAWKQGSDDALAMLEPWRERVIEDSERAPRQLEFLATLLIEAGEYDEAHALLWPRAQEQARWTDIYLTIAATIPDESLAVTWIDRSVPVLERLLPEADAFFRQVQAHFELGRQLDSTAQYERVVELVRPRMDEPGLPIEAYLRLAIAEQELDRVDRAEIAYRKALNINPRHPEALNNLAFLQLQNNRASDETAELAQRAVEGAVYYNLPAATQADLLNTQGQVLLALDRAEAASAAYAEALRLRPGHLGARIGQAEVGLRDQRTTEAERITAEIDRRLQAGERFDDDILRRHEALKRQLQK